MIVGRRFLALILVDLVLFCLAPSGPAWGQDGRQTEKKVVIFVSDYVGTSDLINAPTPNLDALLSHSGAGLMNIRAKNKRPSSSYMSLAAGARVGTIEKAGLSYNSTEKTGPVYGRPDNTPAWSWHAADLFTLFTGAEAPEAGVVNLFIEPAKRYAEDHNPPYKVGAMGTEARELGYRLAALGNSDTRQSLNRNAAILAMDERGVIPRGNVGEDLLEVDPLSPGGLRSNHDQIIDNMQRLLANADILVIDAGDTSRAEMSRANASDAIAAEQRKNAVARTDLLLGRIMKSIDMGKTMLLVLSPNPNKEMLAAGNFGLTPVVVYAPDTEAGLLTSATTRRPGLVSNADLKATVFSFLEPDYPVQGISTVKADNSLERLDQQVNLFTQLRVSRNPLNYMFMVLAALGIAFGALAFIAGRKEFFGAVNYTVYCALSMPLVFLFVSFSQYFSLGWVMLLSLAAALLLAALARLIFKDPLDALLFFTLTTAVLLAADAFTGARLMLVSPLGSDAIAGGRFYGIGNDYMGILLACAIISSLLLLDKLKDLALKPWHQALLGLLPLLLVSVAVGHPSFGANMGGFVTAAVSMGFFYVVVKGHGVSLFKILLIFFLAISAVLGVAQLDALLNPAPSHAGKAISSFHAGGGLAVLLTMIKVKLGIMGHTIYHSVWSLILLALFAALVMLKRKRPNFMLELSIRDKAISRMTKILSAAAVTVFLVNDTGVIAAAIIILYLLNSVWLALSRAAIKDGGRVRYG